MGNLSECDCLAPTWLLNLWDRGHAMAITPDGLRCQSREQKEWFGCRANKGVFGSGKYYFEATVTDEGLCRVGWSTQQVFSCYEKYVQFLILVLSSTLSPQNNKL